MEPRACVWWWFVEIQREIMKLLLDKSETSSAVSLSESTIARMVLKGEFPKPVRAGARVLWRAADLEKWADNLPDQLAKKEKRGRPRLAV
jgi:predicted DNA-binding transcriptional regulator AlpA